MPTPGPQDRNILVLSGFGQATRQPYVELAIETTRVQMSPAEARKIALDLLECAESAETDGFLYWLLHEKLSLELESVAKILQEFRHYRAARAVAAMDPGSEGGV